jgi:hypothetical protein
VPDDEPACADEDSACDEVSYAVPDDEPACADEDSDDERDDELHASSDEECGVFFSDELPCYSSFF